MYNRFNPVLNEQEFILSLAVESYNRQYRTRMAIDEFEIKSIRPRIGFKLGYEIATKRTDDFLRFRIYLNVGNKDILSAYSNQVDQSYSPPMSYEDEILVAVGSVDNWYVRENIYKFRPLNNEELLTEYLALENGTGALLLENGEVIDLS